ncbi:MAG TPA: protein kinase [Polyangiaceae bacterium]|nr:protein kinase [Polyangiaceae bacterium]
MAEIVTLSAGSRAGPGILPGDLVAEKYRVERVLGAGGMGVVLLARHIHLDDAVALKVLSPELLDDEQAVARFRREAQAAAKLKNEHVVRVFDVGVHENSLPYLVMEYLEGGDLSGMIQKVGTLDAEQAADVLIQACSAVSAAHRAGIIHRDLKPSNLFCVPRADGWFTVKVLDFGISRVSAGPNVDQQGITVTGNVVGSPSYMSPEQMRSSSRVDPRTDIWSLGVVLYECLTGKLPFPATTYAEVCVKVTQDPPEPLVGVPPALAAVVLRCLEKDRERRFGTAEELALALVDFAPLSVRHLAAGHGMSRGHASTETHAIAASTPPVTANRTSNQPGRTLTPHEAKSRALPWRTASVGFGAVLVLVGGAVLTRRVDPPASRPLDTAQAHAANAPPPTTPAELASSALSQSPTSPVAPPPRPVGPEVVPAASASSSARVVPSVRVTPAASSSSRLPAAKPRTVRDSHSGTWQR